MYGGGFATIPAYLADIFGTQHVGAIHGRLLTAWSLAGIVGPMLISYLREYQLSMGIPTDQAYNSSFKILALLLVAGFILNLLVKPVNKKFGMTPAELKAEQGAHKRNSNQFISSCICYKYFNAKDSTASCLDCSWSAYHFRNS